ncbi:MAG: hypothetical protein EPN61_12905 [Burkholderiaceae bacterium]|nr:MAG: hypothetical protein EPN61_12905 [Burkholderiaceae bacterium]
MFSAPRDIYGPNAFRLFVDELGGIKRVCQFLKVNERTVKRWLSVDRVPRAAVLALYWETKYGRSQIFSEQVEEIRLLYRRVCLLQEQYTRAKDIITGLRKLHTGTANEPFFEELEECQTIPAEAFAAVKSAMTPVDFHALAARPDAEQPPTSRALAPQVSNRAKSALTAFDDCRQAAARK